MLTFLTAILCMGLITLWDIIHNVCFCKLFFLIAKDQWGRFFAKQSGRAERSVITFMILGRNVLTDLFTYSQILFL